MKKSILMIAALFVAGTVMSQDLTSKKGEMFLPEPGDYAIGIDAHPFLEYFGNFFGGGSDDNNDAPGFNAHPENMFSSDGIAIYAKQFIDANTAYRAKGRLGFNSSTDRMLVPDLSAGANKGDEVEDEAKSSDFGIVLGLGMEKRRGNTRLQGVYGAQAEIGFGTSKMTYDYGNSLEDMGSQLTEVKDGSTLMFGVGVFGGVEYFFAPKMSVGGEYNFGLGIASTGDGETSVDVFGSDSVTSTNAGGSSFGLDTGISGSGSLHLLLHF